MLRHDPLVPVEGLLIAGKEAGIDAVPDQPVGAHSPDIERGSGRQPVDVVAVSQAAEQTVQPPPVDLPCYPAQPRAQPGEAEAEGIVDQRQVVMHALGAGPLRLYTPGETR